MKSIITVQQNEQDPQKFAFAIRELSQRAGNFSWTNSRGAQTSNYTVVNGDKGNTIALGGTAFYTLTFNAASGYDADFAVLVVNEDTGRAKTLTIPGVTTRLLQPGESAFVFVQNSVWYINRSSRWKVSGAPLTLNTDFTNGNDANDGYGTGTGNALKTVEGALGRIANDFDLNTTATPTTMTILMASGSTDSQGIHQSFHAFVGGNGGAAVLIDGNGGSITAAVQFYFGTVIQFRNITLSNAAGNCLELHWGAKAYLKDLITFGACASTHMLLQDGACHLEVDNGYTVSGNATFHMLCSEGSSIGATGTVSISQAIAVTDWVLVASPAYVNLQGLTFNLNGHAVTGSKGLIELNGVVLQSTATLAVTGAVSNGGLIRLTVPTPTLATNQRCIVAAVGGVPNATGTWSITVIDSTHLDLQGSTFGGLYTSGGTVQIGLPGSTDQSTTLGGQYL